MKRTFKKRLAGFAAIAALALALTPLVALGDDDPVAASSVELDGSVTVSGLMNGDTVNYYRIIETNTATQVVYVRAKEYEAGTTYYVFNDPEYSKPDTQPASADDFNDGVYYKVLAQHDWKFTTAVDADQDGIIDCAPGDTSGPYYIEDFTIKIADEEHAADKTINRDMVNAICRAITKNNATPTNGNTPITVGNTNEVTVPITADPVTAGMYMFVASAGPNSGDYVYNPVFVSADYNNGNGTNALELVENPQPEEATLDPSEYDEEPTGVFKKSKLEIEKTSSNPDDATDTMRDVAVGDTIEFTIKAPVPTYMENYKYPFFMITDRLTDGLELTDVDDIKVTVELDGDIIDPEPDDDEITVVVKNDKKLFTVLLSESLLKRVVGAPTVTITYQANVVSDALYQANQMDNTAALTFSNDSTTVGPVPDSGDYEKCFNPNDGDFKDPTNPSDYVDQQGKDAIPGTNTLRDKTRHYTFGIDANVLKPDNDEPDPEDPATGEVPSSNHDETMEIEKVGIEANGMIDETTTQANYGGENGDSYKATPEVEKYQPLSGATFELRTDPNKSNTALKFTNGVKNDSGNPAILSAPDGSITIKGLDKGTYYLRETACPAGYTYDPSLYYTIVITPAYVPDADGNDILDYYTVTITNSITGAKTISRYDAAETGTGANAKPISFLNDSGELVFPVVDGQNVGPFTLTTVVEDGKNVDQTTIVVNKKLGILPATGGSGVFFYLIIGAGIMVIAVALGIAWRRRVKRSQEDA